MPPASPTAPGCPRPAGALSDRAVLAAHDAEVIAMWLHGRAPATARAYRADASAFLAASGKGLREISVGDVQAFGGGPGGVAHAGGGPVAIGFDGAGRRDIAPATAARRLSAVKSLLAYAHRIGYLPFDVGAPVRLPKVRNQLAERILDEADVARMLALETGLRNAALLALLYRAGLRISEACNLKAGHLHAIEEGGVLTIHGKGGRTRHIAIGPKLWSRLAALARGANAVVDPDTPLFRSRARGHLDPSSVHRMVKAAAARAGLSREVSAHWLRHAHASHSLDRGAPIHLVGATLGHADISTTGRYLHARPRDSSARTLDG